MHDEKYKELVEKFGQQLADELWSNRDKSYTRDGRGARTIEQQLLTISQRHQPEVWQAFAAKGFGSALGVLTRYKANGNGLEQIFERIRVAYDAGDDQEYANAIKALIAMRAPAGGARVSDTSPMKPIGAKAARGSLDQLFDSVSTHLQKTGGR